MVQFQIQIREHVFLVTSLVWPVLAYHVSTTTRYARASVTSVETIVFSALKTFVEFIKPGPLA